MSKALAAAVSEKAAVKSPPTLGQQVEALKPQIARLVGTRLADRMTRQAESLLRQDSKLAVCSPLSYLGAVMNSAAVGLEPGPLGLVYFVPFRNNKTNQTEVQFIISYKGMLALVRNSGKVLNIDAKCVYENDGFEYSYGFEPSITHKPALTNRGKLIAVYAVAQLRDGGRQMEVMSVEDVDKIRRVSRAGSSGPWVDWYDEMAKKTVLRKLCKLLPLSIEAQRGMAYDETINNIVKVEDNFGNVLPLPMKTETIEVDAETGEIVEAEAEAVLQPEAPAKEVKDKPATRSKTEQAAADQEAADRELFE